MRGVTTGGNLREKWERWIDGPIWHGVVRMHYYRQIYREIGKLAEARSLPPSSYWQYHLEVYAETQAVAVRRQVDLDPRVASLGKLLSEIASDPQEFTGEDWLRRWDDDDEAFARGRWIDSFGDESLGPIDAGRVNHDLSKLRDAASDVKRYVDRKVAHADWEAHTSEPPKLTISVLDHAIDAVGATYRRYADLIKQTDVDLHVHMLDDWLDAFRVAWADPLPSSHPRLSDPAG